MQTISATQNKNLVDITITKKLILEENDHAVKTRIPGMWGENARYLWINKENAMDIHDGKTIFTGSRKMSLSMHRRRQMPEKQGQMRSPPVPAGLAYPNERLWGKIPL